MAQATSEPITRRRHVRIARIRLTRIDILGGVTIAPNSLSPAYIVIDYHSANGRHKMTIPTRAWSPTSITGDLGSYQCWNETPVDAEDMITALLGKVKAVFLPTAGFDVVTIYTKDTAEAPSIPRVAKALAIVGTSVSAEWAKAVQHNWMFRDAEYAQSKLTFLDAPIGSGWDPVTDLSGIAVLQDIVDQFVAPENAWSSRNDLRPSTFIKITYTLNEKLRREYGMT
jgi:hypothetical protein